MLGKSAGEVAAVGTGPQGRTGVEKGCWAILGGIYLILWIVPALALRGRVRVPYAGLGILVLAIGASLVLVYMAVRFRMSWPRFFAFLVLQLYIVALYGLLYVKAGLVDGAGRVLRDLPSGLYFSLVTWTTVGYGDLTPLPQARLLAASEAVLGYLFMGLLVALLLQWFRGSGS